MRERARIPQHGHTDRNDGGRLEEAAAAGSPGGTITTAGGAANLGELGDVNLVSTPPADGDALVFDAGTATWVPAAPTGPLSNYAATTDPAVTDDDGDGYEIGSRWVNTTTDEEFVCTDASTGAAVWVSTTDQGSGSLPAATDPGDIVVYDGAAYDSLPIGTDTHVLTADSGEALGVKWAAASGSGPSDYVSGASGSGQIIIPDMIETSPTTVPGLVTWLAADHLTGYSDGNTILSWPNRAPGINGFDATAVGSPTYETNELNSLPVIRHGGSAYWRMVSEAVPSPGVSLFIVHKLSSLSPTYSGLFGAGFSDLGGFFIKSTGKSALYAASSVYDGTGAITYGTTNWNYTTVVLGPQTYATRRNGSADQGAAFTGNHGWTSSRIYLANQAAASRVYSGDIAELLIFSRALSSSEITTVESYLSTKYAL